MDVNLRKAAKIEQQISEKLNDLEQDVTTTTVSLNQYDDPISQVDEQLRKFEKSYEAIDELSRIRLRLRRHIGTANSDSGVDKCLARLAYVNKRLAYLTSIETVHRKSPEYIKGVWEDFRSPPDRQVGIYNRHIAPVVYFLNEEMCDRIQKNINDLKIQKSEAEDELLALNVNNTVCIENDEVQCLNKHGVFM